MVRCDPAPPPVFWIREACIAAARQAEMMHVVGTTDQGLERAKTNFTANVTEAKLSDPEWQLLTGNIRIVYNFTPEHFCRCILIWLKGVKFRKIILYGQDFTHQHLHFKRLFRRTFVQCAIPGRAGCNPRMD